MRSFLPWLVCLLIAWGTACRSEPSSAAGGNPTASRPANQPAAACSQPVVGKTLIQPSGLTYSGAFRLPAPGGEHTTFEYGGYALAYRPSGNPQGPDDGYPGSLYATGHAHHHFVAELSMAPS